MSFKHGNHEITLSSGGDFTTNLNGKLLRAPSLAAMKKKLDTAAKSAFEPFVALRDKRYNDEEGVIAGMVRVRVLGIEKSGANRYKHTQWNFVIENNGPYGGVFAELTVDTPENIRAVEASLAYSRETARIVEERKTQQEVLDAAIAVVKADDFAKVTSAA